MCKPITFLVAIGIAFALATPAQADTLIFCDQSPGAFLDAQLAKSFAECQGVRVAVVTEAAEFVTMLHSWGWTDVIISARYEVEEQPFFNELRRFADTCPDAWIEIFLWHDRGQAIPANSMVSATTGYAIWHQGLTAISYANAQVQSEAPGKPTETSRGCGLPTFEGVALKAAADVVPVSPPPVPMIGGPGSLPLIPAIILPGELLDPECLADCFREYEGRLAGCMDERDQQENDCFVLYDEPDEADQLDQCLEQAIQDYMDCKRHARNMFLLCIGKCGISHQ